MSDENLRLKIGHVLFIDIVGYSKLLIEEQKERAEPAHGDRARDGGAHRQTNNSSGCRPAAGTHGLSTTRDIIIVVKGQV